MDAIEQSTGQQNNNGIHKNVSMLLVGLCVVFLAIILGGLILLHINTANYINPFTSPSKTTYQNPFSQPTTSYQNPFSRTQGQSSSYQNPFSGGQ